MKVETKYVHDGFKWQFSSGSELDLNASHREKNWLEQKKNHTLENLDSRSEADGLQKQEKKAKILPLPVHKANCWS